MNGGDGVLYYSSPVGTLRLVAGDRGLRSATFHRGPKARQQRGQAQRFPVLARAAAALDEYFGGRRRAFDIPLDLTGLPPFRRHVLSTLARRVPAGSVVTYGKLAGWVGKPKAARAVGGAMAGNPLPIFVPCHRVIGTQGLCGFGPGLQHKKWLLQLEGAPMP